MRKKLLVFASTFPRWEDDTNPPFVYELSKRLTKDFDVYVLAPHYPGAKRYEVMDSVGKVDGGVDWFDWGEDWEN